MARKHHSFLYIIKHLNKWVPSKGVQKSFAAIVWERKKVSLHFWQSLGSWQDSPKRRHPPPKNGANLFFGGMRCPSRLAKNFGENLPPHWVFVYSISATKKEDGRILYWNELFNQGMLMIGNHPRTHPNNNLFCWIFPQVRGGCIWRLHHLRTRVSMEVSNYSNYSRLVYNLVRGLATCLYKGYNYLLSTSRTPQ